jgi:hypothetical protein
MIGVISSSSSSTTGFFIWIFGIDIILTCGTAARSSQAAHDSGEAVARQERLRGRNAPMRESYQQRASDSEADRKFKHSANSPAGSYERVTIGGNCGGGAVK